MNFTRFLGVAGGIAMGTSLAFGWSISGKVVTEAGQGIPNVTISSFNYAGIGGMSDETGAFLLSDDAISAIGSMQKDNLSVQRQGNILNISNQGGKELKVDLMDAMGKVAFQDKFTAQNIQLDMHKYAGQKMMILRVTTQGSSENYIITKKAVARNALLKEGGPLASFMFSKEGFSTTHYQMSAEVETDVQIVMAIAKSSSSEKIESSSSVNPWMPWQSSSSEKPSLSSSSEMEKSSSSKVQDFINCAGKTYPAGDHEMSVNVDGKNRTFIMHVPSQYKGDKAVPLVVDYHPIGGTGKGQLNGTQYVSQTDPEGVISLYPDGTGGKSMLGAGWNVGPCCSFDDDVKFSREMIKKVEETVCIDSKRVYATGFSMGGGMSNHVACFMSDIYAAVAPAGMDLNKTNSATCNPERPISIIMFRGTNDNVCRYQGGDSGFNDGLNFLGAEGNFKFWAEKNGCTGSPTTNKNGCQEYSNCKDGTKVVLCTNKSTNNHSGSGHDQGDGTVGWPFLKSFTLP